MDLEGDTEEYSLTWKGHVQHVRDCFTKLLQNNDFCDVTLYAEGHKIGAHKVFLTACSGYFQQLFADIKEERPIIVLKGVQFDILQQILKFIYSGQVSLEMEKLNTFLETAEFLKIYGLVKDKIIRNRKDSLVSETDHGINTDSETTESGTHLNLLTETSCQDSFKPSENLPDNNLNNRNEDNLSARLLETKGYGFFEKTKPVQRYLRNSKIDSSPKKNQDLNINEKLSSTQFNPKPEIQKYTLGSPERCGEWTSGYENQSHGGMPEKNSSEGLGDSLNDSTCSLKRKRIKSERCSRELEDIKEIESFNEQDFANSLDAEIDFSEEDDENEDEDESLEKEMLGTSLASKTEDGYRCNICNKTYMKKDSLKKHFAVHTKNTTCMICGITLSRRTHLQRHMKVHGIGI